MAQAHGDVINYADRAAYESEVRHETVHSTVDPSGRLGSVY